MASMLKVHRFQGSLFPVNAYLVETATSVAAVDAPLGVSDGRALGARAEGAASRSPTRPALTTPTMAPRASANLKSATDVNTRVRRKERRAIRNLRSKFDGKKREGTSARRRLQS